MTALSDLLTASNREGLSARSIARNAQSLGFTLNHDTAARYLRGDHGRPDEVTLVALSQVLGISLARLRTASSLPADSTEPYTPPAEASRLTRRQRRAVDEMIRAMIEPTSRRGEVADLAARRPAKKATPRAARRGKVEPPRNG
jgi:transcriptional regulator with XRE-family HTH domain